jgi:glycosyltransferase 2 family protein
MIARATSSVAGFLSPLIGWRGLLLILGVILAWQAFRGMPWGEAWGRLTGIGPGGLLILLGVNIAMLPLMAVRWWQLLQALGAPVGMCTICAYRFAGSAVNYLTPGPHFGGEPLLVYLLHRRHGIPLPAAATSVALDRILELWASIVVLSFSLIMLTVTGSGPFAGRWALPLAVTLLAAVVALLVALCMGKHPLSRFFSWYMRLCGMDHCPPVSFAGRFLEALIQGETLTESLLRRHRRPFLLANLYSLGQWLGVFIECWLMAALLGYSLSFLQLLTLVITARLAFLTPLPAGLGVLESALPWVTAALGLGSVLGFSLCLLIRARDIFFSLAGLGLTMKYLTCPARASTVAKDSG